MSTVGSCLNAYYLTNSLSPIHKVASPSDAVTELFTSGQPNQDMKPKHVPLKVKKEIMSVVTGLRHITQQYNQSYKKSDSDRRWWCADFQHGNCHFPGRSHESVIRGTRCWVEHLCETCMQKAKQIKSYYGDKEGCTKEEEI